VLSRIAISAASSRWCAVAEPSGDAAVEPDASVEVLAPLLERAAESLDLAELRPELPGLPVHHGHTEARWLRHLAEQGVEFGAGPRLSPVDLHQAAAAGADNVRVGLGLDVFLVG
jgi:hypothetical protein